MRITPIQLMFLTFSYMFSGFFLGGVRNFTIVIASFFALCFYAYLGYRGYSLERRGYFDFLRVLVPEGMENVTILLFLILVWIQLLATLVRFSEHIHMISVFLPLGMIALTLVTASFFSSAKGFSVVGRLSEIVPLLLVPLLVTRPFFSFAPMFRDVPWAGQGLFSFISIAPIFYLLSKTVTAGDVSVSRSFRVAETGIEDRGRYLALFLLAGGLLAVAVYGFLLLFEVKAGDVLFRFFLWWTSFVRLAILASVFYDLARERPFARRKGSA